MSDNQIQPLPENPTPQDYGFPENPTTVDRNTWRNQERFLQAYIEHDGHPCAAAEAIGITYQAVYNWRTLDRFSFTKRLELADVKIDESLHAEIIRRGRDGVDHPVIYKGVVTDHYKQFSDNLLMFEYKRRHPEYRDNYQAPAQDNRQVHIHYNFHPDALVRHQEIESQDVPEEDKS